jgi:hypothetical protein
VEPAVLVGVGEHPGHAGLAQLAHRRLGLVGEAGDGRQLGDRAADPLLAPERVDRGGRAQGCNGPDQEPGGDSAHSQSQRVVPRIRTCRWLSWFQSTFTTPRGPEKPVFGPT